jgi:hypothetical protein
MIFSKKARPTLEAMAFETYDPIGKVVLIGASLGRDVIGSDMRCIGGAAFRFLADAHILDGANHRRGLMAVCIEIEKDDHRAGLKANPTVDITIPITQMVKEMVEISRDIDAAAH